jgi:type III pantothenate kinase
VNLILDQGNTKVRLARFNGTKIDAEHTLLYPNEEELGLLLQDPKFAHQRAIFSGVGDTQLYSAIKGYLNKPLELVPDTSVPFSSAYKTPQTWGVDRKALVMAAFRLYPNQAVLVIDAGTCITYDFITDDGVYQGGAISPGLQMRLDAMHRGTARLPQLTAQATDFIGTDTASCMQSGAYHGFILEVNGTIQEYQKRFPHMVTLITGGDAQILADTTKNSIFAIPNLILQGLNFILEYNA